MVSLPEMRKGAVAVCFASLLARARPDLCSEKYPSRVCIDYCNQAAAHAVACGQLAYYRLLEDQGQVQIIRSAVDLETIRTQWCMGVGDRSNQIGVVLAMEGADPIVRPDQVQRWWDQGLRALSLGHYGPGVYAHGTPSLTERSPGGLTPRGRELLAHCEPLGLMLDLTHASDASFIEAIDRYAGPVFASHSNCRTLVPGLRQLTDAQIRQIAQRGGVIGCVPEASMLCRDWDERTTSRMEVGLCHLADHMDHVCQLAGCADHIAIGSDLDGGFGAERCPHDLDTIAGLRGLGPLLSARGYNDAAIAGILHGNWLRFLHTSLPGD